MIKEAVQYRVISTKIPTIFPWHADWAFQRIDATGLREHQRTLRSFQSVCNAAATPMAQGHGGARFPAISTPARGPAPGNEESSDARSKPSGTLWSRQSHRARSEGFQTDEEPDKTTSVRTLVTETQLIKELAELPAWTRFENRIESTFKFPTFQHAIAFVNKVAELSEEMDHHPRIEVDFKSVRLSLITHSAGGLTMLDIIAARRISGIHLA
jgi:4a-hydroxytetrahydrobiopterin dehydratase